MARAAVLLALILAGCVETRYVDRPLEVRVPVPVERAAPAWLAQPYVPEQLPAFVSPQDPSAKAALAEPDLNHLKAILRTLTTRDAAWRAWASPGNPADVQPE